MQTSGYNVLLSVLFTVLLLLERTEDRLPKARVSRRPFELMFFAQVKGQSVTPGEVLVTKMTFIPGHHVSLLEEEQTTGSI